MAPRPWNCWSRYCALRDILMVQDNVAMGSDGFRQRANDCNKKWNSGCIAARDFIGVTMAGDIEPSGDSATKQRIWVERAQAIGSTFVGICLPLQNNRHRVEVGGKK